MPPDATWLQRLTTLLAGGFIALMLAPLPAHATPTVILVRHAEIQGESMAPAKALPLSADGQARARRLADMLQDAGIEALYVSDFARTQETAQPLARALGKVPVVAPKEDMAALVTQLRGAGVGDAARTVLVVGHKDTLPALIKALGHTQDVRIEPADHAGLYVLTPRPGQAPVLLRLRY